MASAHQGLTATELNFIRSGARSTLARLATVDDRGDPRVVPVGWSFDEDLGAFVLGGRDVPNTVRWRHVADHPAAALSIDGVDTNDGWAPWALLVRGHAEQDAQRRAILLHPDRVTSWGLPQAPPAH